MTQYRGPDIDDIKRAANARMFELLPALGITERPGASGYISMCNPMRKDRHPSLTIWTRGGFLTFKDHAGGAQGDVIDLVAYLKGWADLAGKGRKEARRYLLEFTGLARVAPEQLERDRASSRKKQAEIEKKASEDQARAEGRAMALWLKARPDLLGTATDIYLRDARGIDLRALPKGPRGGDRKPGVLRHIDRHAHAESGRSFPCMIAGCVDFALPIPRIRAVHRTWLEIDGSDKAPIEPARKVWPGFAGLVIPIWNGDGDLSVRQAREVGLQQTLVLTEGVEDGLSAALAAPEHRVWAVIALGNLGNVPVPACCDSIIVHRQNDWEKPQAVEQFERAKAALEATGRPVAEVRAFKGKDLNDTLRGNAA